MLPRSSFDRTRKTVGFILGPAVFILLYLLPLGLKPAAQALLAIMALTIMLWVTETLPVPMTSVLGAVLTIVLGVAPAKEAFAPFGDPLILFFLGGFMLARAMTVHGLDRRFALSILSLSWVVKRPYLLVLFYGGIVTFISMWISNTATTAMMFPIALGMIRALDDAHKEESRSDTHPFAIGLFLMAAYMSSIGGIGTPIGSPTNLVGIGMLDKLGGIKLSFLTWMGLTIPIMVFLFFGAFAYLIWVCPPPKELSATSQVFFVKAKEDLGPWTRGEKNTIAAFLLAVVFWVYPGILALIEGSRGVHYLAFTKAFPESVVAILAAILLFLLPVDWTNRKFTLTMQEALKIDWGTLLLVGGALSLGNLMFSTGLAKSMSDALVLWTGVRTLAGITALAVLLSVLITQATSNTATANMLVPLVIAISQSAGVNPISPVLGATLGCSMAFMLPSGTAPNALIYGSGLVPITKMMRHGAVIAVFSGVLVFVGALWLPKFLGLQ